jgi:ribulose-5-phosphate 4-epimerase/fuculose-1-phosphate aldolase
MLHAITVDRVDPRAPEEERTHRKQRLAAAFRLFARFGLLEGSAGHISARDPEEPDHYWINPVDVHWSQIRVSDLLLVDASGDVVEGSRRVNPAGVAIHGQILARLPRVVSVAHSHSAYGKAWSAHQRLLDPLTQDACAFFADHDLVPFTGIVLDDREGEHIAQVLGAKKAVILQNHGLLTVGSSVEEAAWWFISMDRQCQIQLLAESAGRPVPIDPATAARTAEIQGAPSTALSNFRPLWDLVSRQEPDLVD